MFSGLTFTEEKVNKILIIKGSDKAGVVEICRVELWRSQRIPVDDWINTLQQAKYQLNIAQTSKADIQNGKGTFLHNVM